ncbi:MAG TPA: type II CAAX endopeptidase family protein [Puia sp.]|uniref:CPBP family intramembrane glutamic endopeptidase n=1 Tax=Puia sp. TaxID=2045100 RepID=UPI002D0B12BD|nr:type II CAAX endopeptidase family protein [Puia sp.]HVU99341.1 type II CAAX endopeptidase family protein [Puia sp.]
MIDLPTTEKHSESPRTPVIFAGVVGMIFLLFLLITTGGTGLLRLLGLTRSLTVAVFANRTLFWVCLGLVWWYAVRVEKRPLLLWSERRQGFLHYVGALILLPVVITVVLLIVNSLLYALIHKTEHSEALERMVRYCRAHPFLLFYSAITAGFTEELLMRGYLLPRLEMLVWNRGLAIFLSSLLFGLGHYQYGTIKNVVGAMVIGLVLAMYYNRYQNIKVAILFHILWDMAAFYLSFRHV